MKPLLILLLSIIIFSQCDTQIPIIGIKEKSNKDKFLATLQRNCYFARLSGNSQGYKVVDNNDGTVSLVRFETLGSELCPPPFGKTEDIIPQYYIKKCIQGQVYRQAQNDCKGTGTAANYYGAQKLQACPTNNSCSDSVSQAMSSCANDTTTGKVWKPGNFQTASFGENVVFVSNYFKIRTDEIPTKDTDYYWNDSPYFTLTNVNGNTSPGTGYTLNSVNYVLCFQNKS